MKVKVVRFFNHERYKYRVGEEHDFPKELADTLEDQGKVEPLKRGPGRPKKKVEPPKAEDEVFIPFKKETTRRAKW